jgi:polycomb-like protein 2
VHMALLFVFRFYVFVCSLCNYGKEFVRRLEMKWVDIVHLALFNLTIFNAKKYYDLDTVIIPYVNNNWHTFQLPPKVCWGCSCSHILILVDSP